DSVWVTRTDPVPLPCGAVQAFHSGLSLNGANNVLDMVNFGIVGPATGATLTNTRVGTFFERFDASNLTLVLGPTPINAAEANAPTDHTVHMPLVADLPSRHSQASLRTSLFIGEYLGLATKDLKALAAWSELRDPADPPAALTNIDLGLTVIK